MKNIRVALLACMVALFAMSCEKDAEENESPAFSGNRFKVEIASFRDANNSKAYLNYTDALSRIIYESGDKVQINGKSFTLSYEDGEWYANADNGQPYTGKTLYAAYCDGTLNAWDSNASGGPKYNFNINDYLDNNTHNKLLLCGTSNSGSVITLQPACAILRVYTGNSGSTWTNVRVGFQNSKIPATGTINTVTGAINPSTYLQGVSQGSGGTVNGDFLAMRWSKQSSAPGNHASSESGYWYVAIPIPYNEGSYSVTTTLYLGWNNGSSDIQYKTQGEVTLQKGYVYTVGTERQSPFTSEGYSKCSYLVSEDREVLFSAGNLQFQMYRDGSTNKFKWQFAPHQYSYVGSANSTMPRLAWRDLMGYGTSCYNGKNPNICTEEYSDYYDGNLAGTNYDWGVNNRTTPGIYYGTNLVTGESWRTLTSAEWSYLISRPGKCGLGTVAGNKGLILLPDYGDGGADWSLPSALPSGSTLTFNANTTSWTANVYTSAEWDDMENAGAIFLPAGGYRETSNVYSAGNLGYYWSASINPSDVYQGMALQIDANDVGVTEAERIYGCAVRLVIEVAK